MFVAPVLGELSVAVYGFFAGSEGQLLIRLKALLRRHASRVVKLQLKIRDPAEAVPKLIW